MTDTSADRLMNISPLDGRYKAKVQELEEYFSEGALIKFRIKVEIVYVIKLVEFLGVVRQSRTEEKRLLDWGENVTIKDLIRVKEIEKETNHDVKAVEYFIRENLKKLNLQKLSVWIHWGLTSEDVNNLAYGLLLEAFKDKVLVKIEADLIKQLAETALKYKSVAMPARTHGQIALPTTVGKELAVFAARADFWLKKIKELKLGGKLNGAVGNFNSQKLLYPQKDWLGFGRKFVSNLGLEPSVTTTQIEPNDRLVFFLDLIRGLNNVWLDLAKDCWLYIAFDYFKQKAVGHEVGSSTMPHKVNPIDFENSEGNLEVANGLLMLMSQKLPVSRMQRDLSDSTVKRNLGTGMGHTVLAIKSLMKGLNKIEPHREKLKQELVDHPEMLAEAEQLRLKREGDAGAYEKIKILTRGKKKGSERELLKVLNLNVDKYIGLAVEITQETIRRLK